MGSIGGLQIGHQHTSGGFEKKSLKLHLLNKIKKISQQFEVENFNYRVQAGFLSLELSFLEIC